MGHSGQKNCPKIPKNPKKWPKNGIFSKMCGQKTAPKSQKNGPKMAFFSKMCGQVDGFGYHILDPIGQGCYSVKLNLDTFGGKLSSVIPDLCYFDTALQTCQLLSQNWSDRQV